MSVVPRGEARRFLLEPADAFGCAAGTACWIYGGQGTLATRADIGLPLQPIKSLVSVGALPPTIVSAVVTASNVTAAEIELVVSGAAAALYVHVTTASMGTFSDSAFHMLRGERRTLRFVAWGEHGALDAKLLATSLRVHWLNAAQHD